jgi:hypothetical protein
MFSVNLAKNMVSVIILVIDTSVQAAKIEFAYAKIVVIHIL